MRYNFLSHETHLTVTWQFRQREPILTTLSSRSHVGNLIGAVFLLLHTVIQNWYFEFANPFPTLLEIALASVHGQNSLARLGMAYFS
jgi:hypothetical protein